MNSHTFDNHSVTCPICQQRARTQQPVNISSGLFTCPYCQEKIVVCKSGHYVRDPFILRQMAIPSVLRRQSRPFARIIRDFVLVKRPAIILALGSAIVFGVTAVSLQNLNKQENQQDKHSQSQTERIFNLPDNNH